MKKGSGLIYLTRGGGVQQEEDVGASLAGEGEGGAKHGEQNQQELHGKMGWFTVLVKEKPRIESVVVYQMHKKTHAHTN